MGACIGFISLVAVGAVMVVTAKLQFTSIGAGASPIRVLAAAVMAGLATLGSGLRIGAIDVGVVPLGALLVTGALLAWSSRSGNDLGDDVTRRKALVHGLRFGLLFGALCLLGAVIFRIPEGPVPVSVSPVKAGALGFLWGTAFGTLGVATPRAGSRRLLRRAWGGPPGGKEGTARASLVFAGVSLAAMTILALVAVLVGLIFRLATSPLPGRLGAGDAIAGVIYLCVFLPNVLVAVAALATGAPVSVGAQITEAGERLGPVAAYSLADWNGGEPPGIALFLLLVPLLAFGLAGFLTRSRSLERDRFPLELVSGAILSALVLSALCLLGDARLGGGLVSGNGVARVAADATVVIPFAFGWGVAAGLVGWASHDLIERRKRWR